ncbi:MAG: hypothetical protein V4608_15180 [Bacteroidota bacterium]
MTENNDDLEKYFDSKEYITQIIGRDNDTEAEPADENKITNLISLLTDPANKSLKESTLLTLKTEKGHELLLVAIASPEGKAQRHKLVAACWESEINFSNYLPFFILLALDNDYLISLEAITVISTMEGPFNKDHVTEGIKKVKAAKKDITTEKVVLLNDLVVTLEGFLTE